MDIDELADFARRLRQEQGITQQQMAQDLAISRSTLHAFEHGRAPDIGLRKVLNILEYLGYTLQPVVRSPLPTF